jgi:hypothetical protein
MEIEILKVVIDLIGLGLTVYGLFFKRDNL